MWDDEFSLDVTDIYLLLDITYCNLIEGPARARKDTTYPVASPTDCLLLHCTYCACGPHGSSYAARPATARTQRLSRDVAVPHRVSTLGQWRQQRHKPVAMHEPRRMQNVFAGQVLGLVDHAPCRQRLERVLAKDMQVVAFGVHHKQGDIRGRPSREQRREANARDARRDQMITHQVAKAVARQAAADNG